MSSFIGFKGVSPVVDPSVWIAPGVYVIGDVQIGEDSNVWFGSVLRGDVLPICIGKRSNIQDLSLLHTSTGRTKTLIGDDVTVGHRVILHGCTVSNRVLIGMGAIVMDGAMIGEDSIIGAGSLVTENTVIPPRSLAVGSPCRVKRELTDSEVSFILKSAAGYVEKSKLYRS